MPSPKLKTPIEFDRYYHIFNRGNNHDHIFYKDLNYDYFLGKYKKYLGGHVKTYAYCLLPNHFHLLIKTISDKVSSQLQKFFQSYALSINKQEGRSGSLFTKPFRRLSIEDDDYLKWLVFYIHFNPEKHFICSNFRNYQHSSFSSFLSSAETGLEREEVFKWFGNKKDFIDYHNFYHEEKRIQKYIIEEQEI